MKKLTCRELGGPCDQEIAGNSFAEIGRLCRAHVMVEVNGGDRAHREAVDKMKNATPEERKAKMAEFQRRYDDSPDV